MSDGNSYAHLGVTVGTDWRLTCHTYPDSTPILAVDAGRVAVTISPEGRKATDAAVGFARELARQAARFAAEIERLHAAQHTVSGTGAGHDGAADDTAA